MLTQPIISGMNILSVAGFVLMGIGLTFTRQGRVRAPLAVALIAAAARPLTGTSANLTEQPACKTADEVEKQVGGRLPLILDAGAAHGGLASTVVELAGERGRILRPGPVTEDQLKEFLA